MLSIISILIVIIALIGKKSKITAVTMLILLLILFAGNEYNVDKYAYVANYKNLSYGKISSEFEFGFQIMSLICSKLGLSYEVFLTILVIIGGTLIANTITLFTKNLSYVLVLYFFYPFIIDTIQIRNFFAMAIVIFSSRYIISQEKNCKKYIVGILIASSIHISALFYLCGLIVKIKNMRKMMITTWIMAIAGIFVLPRMKPVLLLFISIEKVNAYFTTNTSIITKIAVVSYFILLIALVLIARNILYKKNISDNNKKLKVLDPQAIVKINIFFIPFLYFFMNNLEFFRLLRNIYLLNYILFATCLNKVTKIKRYYFFRSIVLLFVLISFFMFIVYIPTTDIVYPVFNNNYIFK